MMRTAIEHPQIVYNLMLIPAAANRANKLYIGMKKLSFKAIVQNMVLNACSELFYQHIGYKRGVIFINDAVVEFTDNTEIIISKDFVVKVFASNINDLTRDIYIEFNGFVSGDGETCINAMWMNGSLAVSGSYKNSSLIDSIF